MVVSRWSKVREEGVGEGEVKGGGSEKGGRGGEEKGKWRGGREKEGVGK